MNTNYSTTKFSTTYGVLLGLVIVLIAALMYVTGMIDEGKQWPVWVYYLFFPFFIVYCVYEYRKKNDGFVDFKSAFKVGVTVALIGGLVYGAYNLIYFYILEPDTANKVLEITEAKIREEFPTLSDEDVESRLTLVKRFSNPLFSSAMYLLLSAMFGFFYGLIGGAIFKRERPEF